MSEFYIVEAILSEAKTILEIQKESYLSEAAIYNDYQIPPLIQTITEIESDFNSHRFYVAKVNNNIIGSLNIKTVGNKGLIGRLIVRPEMQNQGHTKTRVGPSA